MNRSEPFPPPTLATLKQVAAWDLDHLNAPCAIKASVPALQRGLVWSPQQVELLWDSILRGFPIGCLVVSKKVQQQERSGKTGITHHLLDGQQRCNAIALGYSDPFSFDANPVRGNKSQSILWLDLAPLGTDAFPDVNLSPKSTRQFLTRVTTMAHPWGFNSDDAASRLSASQACKAVEWELQKPTTATKKPSSLELFPWVSNAPVPLSWLIAAMEEAPDEGMFWNRVQKRLEAHAKGHRWPILALDYFKQKNSIAQLREIFAGLARAAQTQLVILEAPSEILSVSRQEQSQSDSQAENVASIEHLFQRLNGQGTALTGEELAYSMIKAYWPGAADAIDDVKQLRFPASHLVTLGVRAALTDAGASELARPVSLSLLRSIAVAVPQIGNAAPTPVFKQRSAVEAFLGVSNNEQGRAGRLGIACGIVDQWLIYHHKNAPNGLPPVLLSSFARGSSAIYLFLLHLADRIGTGNPALDDEWRHLLPGACTLVHWFSDSGARLKIGDALMQAIVRKATPENVRKGIASAIASKLIIQPRKPSEIDQFIQLPKGDVLKTWKWWRSLIGSTDEEKQSEVHNAWWPFLDSTIRQREMLLFAQREYLDYKFPDYDPSRKDLWENTNRPWDFDHLHASAYFYRCGRKKSGIFEFL